MTWHRATLAVASLCLAACSTYGPGVTYESHLAYNEAIQQSEQRELLLNLVRLRYLDGPEFLTIGSISSQMRFDATAFLSGNFGKDSDKSIRLVTPGASAQYSESPTVTFVPQRDEEFTRRLVTPIDLDSVYLLIRYGWSPERVLSLVSAQINETRNPAPREEVTAADDEAAAKFSTLARVLQRCYDKEWITLEVVDQWTQWGVAVQAENYAMQDVLNAADRNIRLVHDNKSNTFTLEKLGQRYVLQVAPEALEAPELLELVELLELPPGQLEYDIDSKNSLQESRASLRIRTRSVLSTMAYLSNGVDVPESDLTSGITGSDLRTGIVDDFPIRVLSGTEAAADAYLSVPYRGHWFYVDAKDLDSRRTLGTLSSLMRLEIGAGSSGNVPVLTLPVSR